MKQCLLVLPLAAIAAICAGCNESPMEGRSDRTAESYAEAAKAAPAQAAAPEGRNADGDKAPVDEQPHKIIYNGRVEMVVEDFEKAQDQLAKLTEEYKGYIAKSDTHGAPGLPRSGEWTLRIPAADFRLFIDDLPKLGELRENKTDSDDITERYYDLKAHVKNDQAEEEALRQLMVEKSAGGKLEDLLGVRRELRELRGKIESQQGQVQRWDKEVALATVVVQMQDRKAYVPDTTPSFGTSIGRTYEGSVGALLAFGRGVVLAVVAAAPWLAVLALPALAACWWLRNRLRNVHTRAKAARPAQASPVSP